MFCQLMSNLTWRSSSIKVLQKKKWDPSTKEIWKLCKAQSAKVQMCESANLVDMDPSSRKNCKLCKAQCAKVQMCGSANRVDMDTSSNAVCKLCNPTSITWPQLTSCKLYRLSVKEKIWLWSWFVGWRVSELHEGVSCRPDVLKCFGLLVKQRRSQCYAPTTAQTIILAMLH